MTYQPQLDSIGSAADAEISTLTSALATANANLATANTTIADQAAKILSLQSALLSLQLPAAPAAPNAAAGSPAGSKTWKLVWGDEFATDGAPDPTKWNTGRWSATTAGDAPFNNASEGAYLASSQVKVSGGQLTITTAASPKAINGVTYPTASGLIQSNGFYSFTPGSFLEARIQIPKAVGCWPAFWLLPAPSGWPPEMDIFEYFDTSKQSHPSFNYHKAASGQTGPTTYGSSTVDYRVGFHTYGLHWNGTSITAYLDGVPSVTATVDTTAPHYLLINLDTYAGAQPPAGTQMVVDWVRAWA